MEFKWSRNWCGPGPLSILIGGFVGQWRVGDGMTLALWPALGTLFFLLSCLVQILPRLFAPRFVGFGYCFFYEMQWRGSQSGGKEDESWEKKPWVGVLYERRIYLQ